MSQRVKPINGGIDEICSYCRLKGLMRTARQDGDEIVLDVDQRGRTVVLATPKSEAAAGVSFIRTMLISRLEDHCVC